MPHKILVTGPTGNVGCEVVKNLLNTGMPVVAGMRHIENIASLWSKEVDTVRLEFGRPATYAPALQGIQKMFLMRPPAIADVDTYLKPFIEVAGQKGVEHVVFLSVLGAEKNKFVPHYAIEQLIKASGMTYTFLRASFFMQNLNTTHRDDIRYHDEIFLPAGKGKTSFIDVRDIAAVAAQALLDENHKNQAYDLTGNEALDYQEVADLFTEVLGRKITCVNPGILRFWRRMKKAGYTNAFVLTMIGIYTTVRLGLAKKVTGDTENLLKRKPVSVRQYIQDYQQYWKQT